ncbi:flagellar basal body-associated protein FliL [Echinimonas agarilytica]|uniref:Flagellar protein FliL n=1 Tax=Echinimonas agarilytica TaxID=1215918 RepID=A0AA41W5P8_9GAMM|nr:flagellar basal body-associated protein FliL [Echinimonas agarilytica]MCM2678973.1 flagellar basal body-associated protein FliL [Echinimonas agarilytica]
MAEEVELEVKPAKSKLPLIIAIVVVLLVGGGVAAYFLLGNSSSDGESSAAEAAPAAAAASAELGDALYVAMPRPFVFSVPGQGRERLVQIKVQLLVRGLDAEQLAKKHIPLVEGTLLKTFSSSTAEELASLAGKERVREQALSDVRQSFLDVEGKDVVEQVLFTGFVLQ